MTDDDWSNRFDELNKINLIELPEKYYEDEIYFKTTEELDDMFTDQEEKNLS